jgi:hypothetical protein
MLKKNKSDNRLKLQRYMINGNFDSLNQDFLPNNDIWSELSAQDYESLLRNIYSLYKDGGYSIHKEQWICITYLINCMPPVIRNIEFTADVERQILLAKLLWLAAKEGEESTVCALLRFEKIPHIRKLERLTQYYPFEIAAKYDNWKCVTLLLMSMESIQHPYLQIGYRELAKQAIKADQEAVFNQIISQLEQRGHLMTFMEDLLDASFEHQKTHWKTVQDLIKKHPITNDNEQYLFPIYQQLLQKAIYTKNIFLVDLLLNAGTRLRWLITTSAQSKTYQVWRYALDIAHEQCMDQPKKMALTSNTHWDILSLIARKHALSPIEKNAEVSYLLLHRYVSLLISAIKNDHPETVSAMLALLINKITQKDRQTLIDRAVKHDAQLSLPLMLREMRNNHDIDFFAASRSYTLLSNQDMINDNENNALNDANEKEPIFDNDLNLSGITNSML